MTHQGASNTYSITINDAAAVVRAYFGIVRSAIIFERRVGHDYKFRSNVITEENIKNTNCLGERLTAAHLGGVGVGGWVNKPVPGLDEIPLDADLLDSMKYDRPAAEAITALHGENRSVAKVSKLLYQKRPGVFPILDDYVRRALGLAWISETGSLGNLQLLQGFREAVLGHPETERALGRLADWVRSNPTAVHGLRLSRVRLFSIVAWSAIARRKP